MLLKEYEQTLVLCLRTFGPCWFTVDERVFLFKESHLLRYPKMMQSSKKTMMMQSLKKTMKMKQNYRHPRRRKQEKQ